MEEKEDEQDGKEGKREKRKKKEETGRHAGRKEKEKNLACSWC